MDLGIGNLFDKIEEYFGETLAKVIMGLMLIVLVMWMINLIIMYLTNAKDAMNNGLGYDYYFGTAIVILIFGCIYWLMLFGIHKWFYNRYEKQSIERWQQLRRECNDMLDEYKSIKSNHDIKYETVLQALNETKEMLTNIKSRKN